MIVTYDSADGTIEIHNANQDSFHLSRSYERTLEKEKVISLIKAGGSKVSFDSWPELQSSFDYLIAVDTNTRMVAGRRLSVTVAYHSPKLLKLMTNEVPFNPLCGYVMLDINSGINPECFGWHLILKNHTKKLGFEKLRLGLIVDSELGQISAMNKRQVPYYRDFLLPNYTTILYASDAAADSLPNMMIRYCDKAAEAVFKYFNGDLSSISHIQSDDDNCKGYAFFQTNGA